MQVIPWLQEDEGDICWRGTWMGKDIFMGDRRYGGCVRGYHIELISWIYNLYLSEGNIDRG